MRRDLDRRLTNLERATPPAGDRGADAARARLSAKLAGIGERLVAAGVPDPAELSPAERVAVALERGDVDAARAVLAGWRDTYRERHARGGG
jgi:hypothetical protein